MTEPQFTLDALLELLEGDREIIEGLERAGLLPPRRTGRYSSDEIEDARVAHVLLRELEVNWPGVEVILRMRTELLTTRRQLASVAARLRERKPG
jgi:hypothetical protein